LLLENCFLNDDDDDDDVVVVVVVQHASVLVKGTSMF